MVEPQVWPEVNNQPVGPFILDTGASGLVITPRAAEKMNLSGFGELCVAGVGGSVQCQYRQAESLKLGPVTILK